MVKSATLLHLFERYKAGMLGIASWLRDKFKGFEIDIETKECVDIGDAANKGCHAALWGNFKGEKVADGVYRITPIKVLGLKFKNPEHGQNLSPEDLVKIASFLRSKHFAWLGTLHVIYENVHPGGFCDGQLRTDKYDLGPYHLKE